MTQIRKDSITARSWFPTLLGLIIGAITLWPMSYHTLNNSTSGIALGWGVFCAIAGLYLGATSDRQLSKIALLVCGGVACAMVIRIIVDCVIDPTNHNLWPFEFVWMMTVCFPTSLAGAILGKRLLAK